VDSADCGVCRSGSAQSALFAFDSDAVNNRRGVYFFATGGGPAGKWLVKEISDAPSARRGGQTMRIPRIPLPVLIADKGDYADLDVQRQGEGLSGKVDQGIGLVSVFEIQRAITSYGQTPGKQLPAIPHG